MRAPEFWRSNGIRPRLLSPLAALYGLAGRCRQALQTPFDVGVPVICVGNLSAGGTGKTPVALALHGLCRELGLQAHFLSRGHGGREHGPIRVEPDRHSARDCGDEPLLLARRGPCWVARDRAAGARAAVGAGAGALIMDDGHQNNAIAKDLSLLVVDGVELFGNGRLMPAGPLRESIRRGAARADAVIVVSEENIARPAHPELVDLPHFHCRFIPTQDSLRFKGRRLLGFAGIGRPEKFRDSLRQIGVDLVAFHGFADHHPFREEEIMDLIEQAQALDAVPVTTAKDYVRLPDTAKAMVEVMEITARFDDAAGMTGLLRQHLPLP